MFIETKTNHHNNLMYIQEVKQRFIRQTGIKETTTKAVRAYFESLGTEVLEDFDKLSQGINARCSDVTQR